MKIKENFRFINDKDWNLFENFSKRNLVKSFISNKKFNKFWFKARGRWSIYCIKIKNSLALINMFLVFKALYRGKSINLCWTSTAAIDKKFNMKTLFGFTMLNLIKKFPIVIMSCGNKHSMPLNKSLGYTIGKLDLRRFILIHNINCLQLVKSKYHNKLKKFIYTEIKNKSYQNINKSLSKKVPKDLNNLWEKFSKNFDLCISKNYNYFKWRYEKAPFQKYNFLQFRNKNGLLIGITVIRFQETKAGICTRIVDFMSYNNSYSRSIWEGTIEECIANNSLYSDFIVYGSFEDRNLISSGFNLVRKSNCFSKIPNLLSPLEHRDWSYSFHIGGNHMYKKRLKSKNKVWFTKGDGDRDWPTPYDIKNRSY